MICKPGSHRVKKHYRISANGKKHAVEEHCRLNSKKKSAILYSSNLDYLFINKKKKYARLKKIKGYKDFGLYDEMIQFWLDYWKSKNEISFNIDPMLIKAIIAVESSFRDKVITKTVGSSATGLMQITKNTMKWLAGKPQRNGHIQVHKNQVDINQDEAKVANSKIAAGTRWLIFKINKSRNRYSKSKEKRLHGGIKFYYGWTEDGQKYLDKVLKVYHENK
jgi:hypothetical protein